MVKFQRVPLLLPTICFCLGIASGTLFDQISIWAIATFLLLCITAIASLSNRFSRKLTVAVCLIFFLLGGFRATQSMWYYPNDHIIRYCQNDSPNTATLKGIISSEVRVSQQRGALAKYDALNGQGVWFDLKVDSICTNNTWQKVSGIVRVYTTEPAINLAYNDNIEITGNLYARSSGDLGFGNYIRRSRIIAGVTVKHNEHIKIINKSSQQFQLTQWLRRKALAIFNVNNYEPGSETEAIAAALLMGERHGLSQKVKNEFLATGTMHYLSLSGLHVSIMTGFVWLILRAFKTPRTAQGVITIFFILAFMAIVPLRPPIVRAGLVMIVFCLGYISRRASSPLNLLALSAFLLLLCKPLDLFDPGFQLSFAIVIALLIVTPTILVTVFSDPTKIILKEKYQLTLLDDRPWQKQLISKVNQYMLSALAISTIAWLVSLGLIAWHFNRIAWLAPLNSVVLAIPVTLSMFAGMIRILLSFCSPFTDFLNPILDMPFQLMLYLNHHLAKIPYSSENIPRMPALIYLGYYSIIIGILILAYKKNFYWLKWCFCCAILYIGSIIFALPFYTAVDNMEIHALGVGHGCCLIIKLPDNKVVVYDCGSYDNFNLVNDIVLPYCRVLGLNHIDAVFISHADLDHYNGIPELTDAIDTRYLFAPAGFDNQFTQSDYDFISLIEKNNLQIKHLTRDSEITSDQFNINVIWPVSSSTQSTNHGSMVIKVSCNNRSILLCGDITPEAIDEIVKSDLDIIADYILLPHHGEFSTELISLIEKCQCDQAVLSARTLSQDRMQNLQNIIKSIHQPPKGQAIILK